MEDKDNLPFIIGALTGLLFAAFMLAKYYEKETGQAPEKAAVAVTSAAIPSTSDEPQTPLPTYVNQRQLDARMVYECAQNGQRIFSDAPCGEDDVVPIMSSSGD